MNRTIESRAILMIAISSLLLAGCEKHSGLPVDGDGNEYDTVVIGTQVWLAEDLKTTKYNYGISIPLVTDNTQWASLSSAAFCWYDNNKNYKENYGALYNQWAVNVNFLCPLGYHVPDDEEWNTLIDYLGGEEIAGAKLKATGTQFWIDNNSQTTNESGFTAMPGGSRSSNDGTFASIGLWGSWWSATSGHFINMFCGANYANLHGLSPRSGFSVRCVKDN